MTGFKNPPKEGLAERSAPRTSTEINSGDIHGIVERANQMRAQRVGTWLRHCWAEWRSIWRRPGRAVSKTYRSTKANA